MICAFKVPRFVSFYALLIIASAANSESIDYTKIGRGLYPNRKRFGAIGGYQSYASTPYELIRSLRRFLLVTDETESLKALPPYEGSIASYFPDVVNPYDHYSFYDGATYRGVETREYWDFRNETYGWNYGKSHVIDVRFKDDVSFDVVMNVEDFPNPDAALEIVNLYMPYVGMTPEVFRNWLDHVVINGPGAYDGDGGSGANAESRTMNYNIDVLDWDAANGVAEEYFIQGAALAVSKSVLVKDSEWIDAVTSDSAYLSTYAQSKPDEDISEAMVAFVALRCSCSMINSTDVEIINEQIPARLSYLNSKFTEFDLVCPSLNYTYVDDGTNNCILTESAPVSSGSKTMLFGSTTFPEWFRIVPSAISAMFFLTMFHLY